MEHATPSNTRIIEDEVAFSTARIQLGIVFKFSGKGRKKRIDQSPG